MIAYEYSYCIDEVRYLNEAGAEGWRVVPGSRQERDLAGVLDVWLMERIVTLVKVEVSGP